MKYIYPSFSKLDLGIVRLGGAGLGNLLFTFARTVAIAEQNNMRIIWPTWPSIKIGPWIRREKDKRFYGDLFCNDGQYVGGFKKVKCLLLNKKIAWDDILRHSDLKENAVYVYDGFRMKFDELLEHRIAITDRTVSMTSAKYKKSLEHNFENEINVHVRLGDFARANISALNSGVHNMSIPIEWYVQAMWDIRGILGEDVTFNVFSDGADEELGAILEMPNVRRMNYGSAIADMIALSQSKLIIASGSSFSMWARFLGNSACITYTNQLKEEICTDPDGFDFCYGLGERIPDEITSKIANLYHSKQL